MARPSSLLCLLPPPSSKLQQICGYSPRRHEVAVERSVVITVTAVMVEVLEVLVELGMITEYDDNRKILGSNLC